MTDNLSWSANFGRWFGIPVRVHLLLFLFVSLIFGVQWYWLGERNELMGTATVTTLVVLASLILHELAHIFAVSNLGGSVNHVILTPWGGCSDFEIPNNPREKTIVYLAGPFINTALFAFSATLLIQAGNLHLPSFLEWVNPVQPIAFDSKAVGVSVLKIVTWVNFQIAAINLLPCFPFDGGKLIRSVIEFVSPEAASLRKESTIKVIGYAVGATMIGAAWFLKDTAITPFPPSMLLLGAGITLIFAAKYSYDIQVFNLEDAWDDAEDLEYDSIYGDSSFFDFTDTEHSTYSQWLVEKQEERERIESERERREELLADDILKKVQQNGIESISNEERDILYSVSERIRKRRQQGV